jgi:hypothetical protein
LAHSPQRSQAVMKSDSGRDHGGRIGKGRLQRSPRRNCLRETAVATLTLPKKVRQN